MIPLGQKKFIRSSNAADLRIFSLNTLPIYIHSFHSVGVPVNLYPMILFLPLFPPLGVLNNLMQQPADTYAISMSCC